MAVSHPAKAKKSLGRSLGERNTCGNLADCVRKPTGSIRNNFYLIASYCLTIDERDCVISSTVIARIASNAVLQAFDDVGRRCGNNRVRSA